MSRTSLFSILFSICTCLVTIDPPYAQDEGEIFIISKRVGKEVDPEEREKFKLFEGVKGFQSAVCFKLPDGSYLLKILYRDKNTGELKISRVLQSDASIKNRGNYINRFEEIQARKEEEESGGEIITISELVGKEIDQAERDKFKLFQGVKGFQSAVYIKLPVDRYFLKIAYLDEETGELKIKRIEQSEVLINISRYYINHFEETNTNQDTVYQKPSLSFFLEFGGKIWYSLNVDFRRTKSEAISVGIQQFADTSGDRIFVPSFMYYRFIGKRYRTEIGGGITGGFSREAGFADMVFINGVIGYRHQKKNGPLFRIGFTPFMSVPFSSKHRFAIIPWAGVSLGFSL